VLIDRYPTVEFASAGTNGTGLMASIIKDRSGKQVPVGAMPSTEYANVRLVHISKWYPVSVHRMRLPSSATLRTSERW
jgi:hypothetical protein